MAAVARVGLPEMPQRGRAPRTNAPRRLPLSRVSRCCVGLISITAGIATKLLHRCAKSGDICIGTHRRSAFHHGFFNLRRPPVTALPCHAHRCVSWPTSKTLLSLRFTRLLLLPA